MVRALGLSLFVVAASGCTSGEVGSTCGGDDQCRGDQPACLTDVEGGYCTAACGDDDDCCQAEGDCAAPGEHVCSSYEDSGERYCFLACEGDGPGGDQATCDELAPGTECRNTGGGVGRMVCLPTGDDG